MPTLKQNKDNHNAFFKALGELCTKHKATVECGGVIVFADGMLREYRWYSPGRIPTPAERAAITARYLVHSISNDRVMVEGLEYNFHVEGSV